MVATVLVALTAAVAGAAAAAEAGEGESGLLREQLQREMAMMRAENEQLKTQLLNSERLRAAGTSRYIVAPTFLVAPPVRSGVPTAASA
jgi:hypothetical protein